MFEAGDVANWFYSIFFKLYSPGHWQWTAPMSRLDSAQEGASTKRETELPNREPNNIQYLSPFNPSRPYDHCQYSMPHSTSPVQVGAAPLDVVHDYVRRLD